MVPDRQKVRTDGRNGRTHGRRQNYIPPTSSGDNNRADVINASHSTPIYLNDLPIYLNDLIISG